MTDKHLESYYALEKEVIKLKTQNTTLLAELRQIEWIHIPFHDDDFLCPSCLRNKKSGHAKGCSLIATLAAAEMEE